MQSEDLSGDNIEFSKKPERALLKLRKELKLFANLRPAICFEQLVGASTLKPEVVSGLDIMIVRELTGGIYFGEPRGIKPIENGERKGINTHTYTTSEITRVARVAFDLARKRSNKVTSCEKSNVMEDWTTMVKKKFKNFTKKNIKMLSIFFDATSAGAHKIHHEIVTGDQKQMIDLTPAAIGPYCVPVVNLESNLDEGNVNLVTCGGQATIPMVSAVNSVSKVRYAEIVASVSSSSAGPGTRANIDEFTQTTALGLEKVGGAEKAKAIIILNPAEPPLLMRNTVFTLSDEVQEKEIEDSIKNMVKNVQSYVPGYRLKQEVQFERFGSNNPCRIPGIGEYEGIKTSIFLVGRRCGALLPKYAGIRYYDFSSSRYSRVIG